MEDVVKVKVEYDADDVENIIPATTEEDKKFIKIPFTCGDCGMSEEADYFGRKPPFCRSFIFGEDSYVCRDPFSPQGSTNNANFLLLGSNCALCSKMTCQECSVYYYAKRFCSVCWKNPDVGKELPPQIMKGKGDKNE